MATSAESPSSVWSGLASEILSAVVTGASDGIGRAIAIALASAGVDVVLDLVGGEVTRRSFRCIARTGRHVIAGFSSGIEAEDTGIEPRPIIFGSFALLGIVILGQSLSTRQWLGYLVIVAGVVVLVLVVILIAHIL